METSEERLEQTKKFVEELIKKEHYYKWSAKGILIAINNALSLGIYSLPKEDK